MSHFIIICGQTWNEAPTSIKTVSILNKKSEKHANLLMCEANVNKQWNKGNWCGTFNWYQVLSDLLPSCSSKCFCCVFYIHQLLTTQRMKVINETSMNCYLNTDKRLSAGDVMVNLWWPQTQKQSVLIAFYTFNVLYGKFCTGSFELLSLESFFNTNSYVVSSHLLKRWISRNNCL